MPRPPFLTDPAEVKQWLHLHFQFDCNPAAYTISPEGRVSITGDCLPKKRAIKKMTYLAVKFDRVDGQFSVAACQHLKDLTGSPDYAHSFCCDYCSIVDFTGAPVVVKDKVQAYCCANLKSLKGVSSCKHLDVRNCGDELDLIIANPVGSLSLNQCSPPTAAAIRSLLRYQTNLWVVALDFHGYTIASTAWYALVNAYHKTGDFIAASVEFEELYGEPLVLEQGSVGDTTIIL